MEIWNRPPKQPIKLGISVEKLRQKWGAKSSNTQASTPENFYKDMKRIKKQEIDNRREVETITHQHRVSFRSLAFQGPLRVRNMMKKDKEARQQSREVQASVRVSLRGIRAPFQRTRPKSHVAHQLSSDNPLFRGTDEVTSGRVASHEFHGTSQSSDRSLESVDEGHGASVGTRSGQLDLAVTEEITFLEPESDANDMSATPSVSSISVAEIMEVAAPAPALELVTSPVVEEVPASVVEEDFLAEEQPSSTMEEDDSNAMEEQPSSAMEKDDKTVKEEQPSSAMEDDDNTVKEEQPSSAMEEDDNTVKEEQPSSAMEEDDKTVKEEQHSPANDTHTSRRRPSGKHRRHHKPNHRRRRSAPNPRIKVFPNTDELGDAVAERISRMLRHNTKKPTFTVALSGGSLPKMLAEGLLRRNADEFHFEKWRIFFADERLVPADHEDSNLGACQAAFIDRVGIPPEHVFGINSDVSVDECAQLYQETLAEEFGVEKLPKFDLILLGMGPDGHTCSLFPGHELLHEEQAWVAPIHDSPKPPAERITLTYPVLNNARNVFYMSAGESKADAIANVTAPTAKALSNIDEILPAGRVRPTDGHLVWFIDEKAGSKLGY